MQVRFFCPPWGENPSCPDRAAAEPDPPPHNPHHPSALKISEASVWQLDLRLQSNAGGSFWSFVTNYRLKPPAFQLIPESFNTIISLPIRWCLHNKKVIKTKQDGTLSRKSVSMTVCCKTELILRKLWQSTIAIWRCFFFVFFTKLLWISRDLPVAFFSLHKIPPIRS